MGDEQVDDFGAILGLVWHFCVEALKAIFAVRGAVDPQLLVSPRLLLNGRCYRPAFVPATTLSKRLLKEVVNSDEN